MDWSIAVEIIKLINPKLYIVLVVCWLLGYALKNSPRVPNWTIVFYVMVFAIVFAVWMMGPEPEVVLQGILCGAVSVYGYEFIKGIKGAKKDIEDGVK